jgi:hypothetical protein
MSVGENVYSRCSISRISIPVTNVDFVKEDLQGNRFLICTKYLKSAVSGTEHTACSWTAKQHMTV